ncbi:MAG TPA: hypothetical protein VL551_29670 [Actinospica sp.]|jgi:hypothetical protein|nr:hypothetical protein [Actinospica sp.]
MGIVVTAVVVIAILLAGAAAYVRWQAPDAAARLLPQRSNTKRLQRRYGREYDRLYAKHGDHAAVEQELSRRERGRADLTIRPLEPADRARLTEGWRTAQTGFVDDPGGATRRAQQVIGETLALLGYPADDPEEQLALVSVDHARTLSDFREGHELMQRSHTGAPDVDSTEQLRQVLLRFRTFFEDLVGAEPSTPIAERINA